MVAHKKSSACEVILILENIPVTPAHNVYSPEVITNSSEERVRKKKKRKTWVFLIHGTTFPLFHNGLRSLPSYLSCFKNHSSNTEYCPVLRTLPWTGHTSSCAHPA